VHIQVEEYLSQRSKMYNGIMRRWQYHCPDIVIHYWKIGKKYGTLIFAIGNTPVYNAVITGMRDLAEHLAFLLPFCNKTHIDNMLGPTLAGYVESLSAMGRGTYYRQYLLFPKRGFAVGKCASPDLHSAHTRPALSPTLPKIES